MGKNNNSGDECKTVRISLEAYNLLQEIKEYDAPFKLNFKSLLNQMIENHRNALKRDSDANYKLFNLQQTLSK